jgi:transcriptional regulator with XRE-family HTH domain
MRRVGKMMRKLREQARKTANDAADRLDCSQPKITRIETGEVSVKLAELEALLGYYGVSDDQRQRVLHAWRESKQKSIWSRFADALTNRFRSFVELESDAEVVRQVDVSLVPGLLQTERYARALRLAAKHFPSPVDVERALEARAARQRRLTEDEPVKLHAIVDEAALRRLVGGVEVMREQLEHLVEMGRRRNITIQVLPFGAGAYATMVGPFIILEFADPDDLPTVYREHLGGGSWVEDEAEIEQYTKTFDDLRKQALSAKDSADFIKEIAAGLDPH